MVKGGGKEEERRLIASYEVVSGRNRVVVSADTVCS